MGNTPDNLSSTSNGLTHLPRLHKLERFRPVVSCFLSKLTVVMPLETLKIRVLPSPLSGDDFSIDCS